MTKEQEYKSLLDRIRMVSEDETLKDSAKMARIESIMCEYDSNESIVEYDNDYANAVDNAKKGIQYGVEHLSNQGVTLGSLVESFDELAIDREYCIVDLGLNQWNGGYKYTGKTLHGFYFEDIITPDRSESLSIPEEDMAEMIRDKQIAWAV